MFSFPSPPAAGPPFGAGMGPQQGAAGTRPGCASETRRPGQGRAGGISALPPGGALHLGFTWPGRLSCMGACPHSHTVSGSFPACLPTQYPRPMFSCPPPCVRLLRPSQTRSQVSQARGPWGARNGTASLPRLCLRFLCAATGPGSQGSQKQTETAGPRVPRGTAQRPPRARQARLLALQQTTCFSCSVWADTSAGWGWGFGFLRAIRSAPAQGQRGVPGGGAWPRTGHPSCILGPSGVTRAGASLPFPCSPSPTCSGGAGFVLGSGMIGGLGWTPQSPAEPEPTAFPAPLPAPPGFPESVSQGPEIPRKRFNDEV